MRGRNIKRYGYDFEDIWLLNTHNGIREKGIKPIKVEDYPEIKRHLDLFYNELEERADKGVSPYNLRNCAYMEDFSEQKIIWGEISDKTKFCIDPYGHYFTDTTTFILTGESLFYLLGFLNSKLSEYIFSQIGTTTGVGTIRWKKFTIEQLRVPKISLIDQEKYNNTVKMIIDHQLKGKPTLNLLRDLDDMFYNEFSLSSEEVDFVRKYKI